MYGSYLHKSAQSCFRLWCSSFLKLKLSPARSKTRKPRKSRKIFSEIFISESSIFAVGQNRKLGIIFPRFPRFPSFRFAIFSFFKKNFFSIFYNRQFGTLYLCYVLFSKPFEVFFPSAKNHIVIKYICCEMYLY